MAKISGLLGATWRKRAIAAGAVFALMVSLPAMAGGPVENENFKVLAPIVHGNLAIFPVVAARNFDTSEFITLDEGVHSGQVTVTEAGEERGLVRPGQAISPRPSAQVNNLVLYNNSSRPLLLLAGEIVTGGKQDRVIGSDRIVPANTGPIDLGVFCVEPGRWVGASSKFGSMGAQMAQPSVRTPAMAERDQLQVWANVRESNARIANNLSAPEAAAMAGTTSYAKVFQSAPVEKIVAGYGGLESEQSILRELRAKNATGVVVAVNGQIVWADVFASTDLLAKYWPKLMRSYVAEAMTSGSNGGVASQHDADLYMRSLSGGREVVETEAGIFRRTEVSGDAYRVFALTSLLPKTDFTVHIAKMREDVKVGSMD
ncbi:MAG TPA: DUF6569 family protein [Terracidiphilus sp.]|nr:DUF6569 family protein [Terracidiphilus sp.]